MFIHWPKSKEPWQRIYINFFDVNKIKLLIFLLGILRMDYN